MGLKRVGQTAGPRRVNTVQSRSGLVSSDVTLPEPVFWKCLQVTEWSVIMPLDLPPWSSCNMRPFDRLETEGQSGVATPLYTCMRAACHLPAALSGLGFLI